MHMSAACATQRRVESCAVPEHWLCLTVSICHAFRDESPVPKHADGAAARSIFSVFPYAPFPDESLTPNNDTHYKVRRAARHRFMLLPLGVYLADIESSL